MQPKHLGNITDPEEIQRISQENMALQQQASHKYYEAGMQAQHEAMAIRNETHELLLKDVRERADLKKTAKLFTVAIIVYGAIQALIIWVAIYMVVTGRK